MSRLVSLLSLCLVVPFSFVLAEEGRSARWHITAGNGDTFTLDVSRDGAWVEDSSDGSSVWLAREAWPRAIETFRDRFRVEYELVSDDRRLSLVGRLGADGALRSIAVHDRELIEEFSVERIDGRGFESPPVAIMIGSLCGLIELVTDCEKDCTEACPDAALVMWREGDCGFCTCICFA